MPKLPEFFSLQMSLEVFRAKNLLELVPFPHQNFRIKASSSLNNLEGIRKVDKEYVGMAWTMDLIRVRLYALDSKCLL